MLDISLELEHLNLELKQDALMERTERLNIEHQPGLVETQSANLTKDSLQKLSMIEESKLQATA